MTQEGLTLPIYHKAAATGKLAVNFIQRREDPNERQEGEESGRPMDKAVKFCGQIEFFGQIITEASTYAEERW